MYAKGRKKFYRKCSVFIDRYAIRILDELDKTKLILIILCYFQALGKRWVAIVTNLLPTPCRIHLTAMWAVCLAPMLFMTTAKRRPSSLATTCLEQTTRIAGLAMTPRIITTSMVCQRSEFLVRRVQAMLTARTRTETCSFTVTSEVSSNNTPTLLYLQWCGEAWSAFGRYVQAIAPALLYNS